MPVMPVMLKTLRPLFVFALSGAAACSSGGSSSGDPSAVGESSLVRADVHAASEPPPRGNQTMSLTLSYVDGGAPASGLELIVVPWMPAMGHGTSVTPTVSESSPGTYELTNVDLYMPGEWQLRTSVTGAGFAGDKVAPSFDVP